MRSERKLERCQQRHVALGPHQSVLSNTSAYYKNGFVSVSNFTTADFRDIYNPSLFTERDQRENILKQFYETVTTKSNKFEEQCFKYENLQYGSTSEQSLDIFYPRHYQPETGIVIFYHGGYWSEGSTSAHFFVAKPFVEAGKICILVRRLLLPTVRLGEMVDQDVQAMSCVVEHFPQSRDLSLFGHSSGGHECVMMLSKNWSDKPKVDEYLRQKLARVVPLCGIFEVTHLLDTTLDDQIGLSWEEANKYSPIACLKQLAENMKNYDCKLTHVNAGKEAPTILKWGDIYKKELKAAGIPFSNVTMKQLDHFNILDEFDDPDSPIVKVILGKENVH